MTPQQRIYDLLSRAGIPAKDCKVYGSQIMVTASGKEAAEKWAALLAKFCRKVRTGESYDYAKENKGTCLMPSRVAVWRIWGTI